MERARERNSDGVWEGVLAWVTAAGFLGVKMPVTGTCGRKRSGWTGMGKPAWDQRAPVLPKPPVLRSEAAKSSTTRKLACTTGTMTSWASRSKGCRV